MTTLNFVLHLIPALVAGAIVAGLILKRTTRSVVPRAAVAAAIVIFVGIVVYSLVPDSRLDSVWIGVVAGTFTLAVILAFGYVYGDAKRRGMQPVLWVLIALLVPNLVGFLLYFVLRKPLLGTCQECGRPIAAELAFCPHCGQPQRREGERSLAEEPSNEPAR